MGDGQRDGLAQLAISDSFLRRVQYQRQMRDGVVHWRAFKPRQDEENLSLTIRRETLLSDDGIEEYQLRNALPSGDLPGILLLTLRDLTVDLNPPRRPWHNPDPKDKVYGHLHYSIELPEDTQHMEKLAALATNNGVIREVVRNRDQDKKR